MRAGYEATAKELVLAASNVVEVRLGAGTGAMIMLEDEAAGIAAPASRLAARHIPMPGGAGAATDLGDAIQLVVAVAGYVIRGFARRAQAFAAAQLRTQPQPGRDRIPADSPYATATFEQPPAVASWPASAQTAGLG